MVSFIKLLFINSLYYSTMSQNVTQSSTRQIISSNTQSSYTSTSITQPSISSTTSLKLNYNNYCGTNTHINCYQQCPTGLDSECVTPGYFCIYSPSTCVFSNTPSVTYMYSQTNFCGLSYTQLNCSLSCPQGKISECSNVDPNYSCYNSPSGCTNTGFSKHNLNIINIISLLLFFMLL